MIKLPPLPYEYDALEDKLSSRVVRTHYDIHTRKYYSTVNELIKGTIYEDATDAESLLTKKTMAAADSTLFNNIAQAWNHTFFWDGLSATSNIADIGSNLLDHLQRDIGPIATIKKQFIDKATQHFGSGWAWIVLKNGKIIIKTTPNAGSPLTSGEYPLIGIDLWEHSYYLQYISDKRGYLNAVWGLINWKVVNDRYNKKD